MGTTTPCKPFEGYVSPQGYGMRRHGGTPTTAHRVAYIEAHGAIPDGLQIDHLCHDPDECPGGNACPHRRCVEVTHLAAVTQGDNLRRGGSPTGVNARKAVCSRGHAFTEKSKRADGKGRRCRECANEDAAKQRRKG